MLITKESKFAPLLNYPQSDYSIVKYLDLLRFMSLLERQEIFFCNLKFLEDKFEGTISNLTHEYRIQFIKDLNANGFYTPVLDENTILDLVNKELQFEKEFRHNNYSVNCWNKSASESAALWKIYSDFSKGIMIKSTIGRLTESLKDSKEEIYISEVSYIDYKNYIVPDNNMYYPVIHKHSAYNYETEIRMIYNHNDKISSPSRTDEGFYIRIHLQELIESIIVSPYSPKWFYELICGITKKYNLNVPIEKSILTPLVV